MAMLLLNLIQLQLTSIRIMWASPNEHSKIYQESGTATSTKCKLLTKSARIDGVGEASQCGVCKGSGIKLSLQGH